MRASLFSLILASAACLVAAGPAQAIICYLVYDRNENVIYQSSYPPVDMSSAGEPTRDAMRKKGEHLTFGDMDECPTAVFLTGVGGNSAIRIDDVVAGMPAGGTPSALTGRGPSSATAAKSAPPAPRAGAPAYK